MARGVLSDCLVRLVKLYQRHQRRDLLEWAMADVVRFRRDHYIEDDHVVSAMFFSEYVKHIENARKDEL